MLLWNKTMRLYEITQAMSEMALKSYTPVGFKRNKKGELNSGGFNKVDRELVNHDKFKEKLTKFFATTEHPFYIYTLQKPGVQRKYEEHGYVSLEEANRISPEIAEMINEVQQSDPGGIHVIYVGNAGAEYKIMTPWIMAHRMSHSIAAHDGRAGSRSGVKGNVVSRMATRLFSEVENVLKDHYMGDYHREMNTADSYKINGMWLSAEAQKVYAALFNNIGTMKSARNKKIVRPHEFVHEIVAQYILTGKVTFNKFPASIKLTTPTGRIKRQYTAHQETDELYAEELQQLTNNLSADLAVLCEDILSAVSGKIFVM